MTWRFGKRSALSMVDAGEAEVLTPAEYPEPLRRFLARERMMVHVKLSAAARRKLEDRSRRAGLPPDELAKRWLEQRLRATGS
ncbi:MAG: hypothetical protein Q7R41_17660 [Phycisphaerales bacterium]|nr:hypothetical protein [Phycisphaerales bacterium]